MLRNEVGRSRRGRSWAYSVERSRFLYANWRWMNAIWAATHGWNGVGVDDSNEKVSSRVCLQSEAGLM